MDLGIRDRIALVTAASRGLGRAIAHQLSLEGARLVICSRHAAGIRQTAAEIASETGNSVKAFTCDVTDNEQVNKMMQEIEKEFNRLDILVCNAGGPPAGSYNEFDLDDYRQALELNLLSTVRLCRAALPFMQSRKWGRIIAVTSVSVKQPLNNLILSNTARSGVTAYLKTLANQVAGDCITVNAVLPGYTHTTRLDELAGNYEKNGQGSSEDFFRELAQDIPAGRLGTPGELAQVVAFLSSEGAGYINGVSLPVDGGFVKSLL
ncbi:MAG: SDR family oxidoreductase [Candidatus Cloacimonetes bacterium]|nr:SDR family oxidoreductase [Candidatus Cloacimonadota bacterium]